MNHFVSNPQNIMNKIKTLLAFVALLLLSGNAGAQHATSGKSVGAHDPAKKLDAHIILAIQQSENAAPGEQPMPSAAIPVREGDRILVDLTANVSEALRTQIINLGGKPFESPDPAHVIRVMMPLKQMEALASRSDVMSIVPAQLSFTNGAIPVSR